MIPYNADFLLEPYLGHEKTKSATAKPNTSAKTPAASKKKEYPFRGAYAEGLSYAMNAAADKTDYLSVWSALMKLAEKEYALQYGIAHENFLKGVRFINTRRQGGAAYIYLTREDVREKVEHWVKTHYSRSSSPQKNNAQ